MKPYRFGFDFWGLLLFLLVMLPHFIWFATNRNNIPAVLSAIDFTVCHVIFGVVNFV